MVPELTRPAIDIGVVVTDLAAAVGFYHETIGLPVRSELVVRGVGRMIVLAAGDASIKLIEPDAPVEHFPAPGGLRGQAAGLRYCTFPFDDVAAALARCVAAGFPAAMPLSEIGGHHVAATTDPDGNWIEFIAKAPATMVVPS